MTIIQRPDNYSLSSTIKDFILNSDASVTFKVMLGTEAILEETYSPTAAGLIRIRDLGKLFEAYLTGEFIQGEQTGLCKTFNFYLNAVASGSVTVLPCKAYASAEPNAFWGENLLTLQYSKKRTIALAKEFQTAYLTPENPLMAKVYYLAEGVLAESEFVNLLVVTTAGFYTVDASFRKVALLFNSIPIDAIVSYVAGLPGAYVEYLVDRETYLSINNFVFLNSFQVPESIICRGLVTRKGIVSFDTAKIHRIERKYNVQRSDTFEVSVGKIFNKDEYRLVREMLSSELVKVFFAGEYRPIIITEEDMTLIERPGSFSTVKFTFRFADPLFNVVLADSSFVLEDGTWNDAGVWYDDGHMNDLPE
jgi:hypothetical protein